MVKNVTSSMLLCIVSDFFYNSRLTIRSYLGLAGMPDRYYLCNSNLKVTMKTKILVSALLLTISFTATRANGSILDRAAVDITKISLFRMDPITVVRNILSNALPQALRDDIKKEYKDYWISGLYEQLSNNRASYFITVENADQIVRLSSTDSKNWVLISTTIKDL